MWSVDSNSEVKTWLPSYIQLLLKMTSLKHFFDFLLKTAPFLPNIFWVTGSQVPFSEFVATVPLSQVTGSDSLHFFLHLHDCMIVLWSNLTVPLTNASVLTPCDSLDVHVLVGLSASLFYLQDCMILTKLLWITDSTGPTHACVTADRSCCSSSCRTER